MNLLGVQILGPQMTGVNPAQNSVQGSGVVSPAGDTGFAQALSALEVANPSLPEAMVDSQVSDVSVEDALNLSEVSFFGDQTKNLLQTPTLQVSAFDEKTLSPENKIFKNEQTQEELGLDLEKDMDPNLVAPGMMSLSPLEPVVILQSQPEHVAASSQESSVSLKDIKSAQVNVPQELTQEVTSEMTSELNEKNTISTESKGGKLSLEGLDTNISSEDISTQNLMKEAAQILSASGQNASSDQKGESEAFSFASSKEGKDTVKTEGISEEFLGLPQAQHIVKPSTFAADSSAPVANPEQVLEESLNQIVTKAKTIVREGGGEMHLKLNPEGMGAIDLKIGVKNGQVQVMVNTVDQNVKKLFEESASDIRNALEIHNLKMEPLKIQVVEAQDMRSFQGFDQQDKDFARQFMGQFREQRQNLRNLSVAGTMERFRGPSAQAVGLQPAARYGSRAMSSSMLNVVA